MKSFSLQQLVEHSSPSWTLIIWFIKIVFLIICFLITLFRSIIMLRGTHNIPQNILVVDLNNDMLIQICNLYDKLLKFCHIAHTQLYMLGDLPHTLNIYWHTTNTTYISSNLDYHDVNVHGPQHWSDDSWLFLVCILGKFTSYVHNICN